MSTLRIFGVIYILLGGIMVASNSIAADDNTSEPDHNKTEVRFTEVSGQPNTFKLQKIITIRPGL